MGWAENVKKIESRSQESESRIKLRKFLSIEPQNKEPQNLEVINFIIQHSLFDILRFKRLESLLT
jgi:hypothetical protein